MPGVGSLGGLSVDSPAQSSLAGRIRTLLLRPQRTSPDEVVGSPVQCSNADSDGRRVEGYMGAVQTSR